jgi:hypothetical protein
MQTQAQSAASTGPGASAAMPGGRLNERISYATSSDIAADELLGFYERQGHATSGDRTRLARMIDQAFCFVTARVDGELVGMARGVTDGVDGYLAECKLDPAFQGPACITRKDGRIEHDSEGIAAEMARRVFPRWRITAWIGFACWPTARKWTFCEEQGFKRVSGMALLERAARA